MNTTELIAAIMAADERTLELALEAIRTRRTALRQERGLANRASLSPGDKVTLHGLSPKYLNGLVAEVVGDGERSNKGTTVRVRFVAVHAAAKAVQRYGPKVNVPAANVTKVEAP